MESIDLPHECDVTFFVPCLNEEGNVIGAIETILAAAKTVGCSFEIIIVDDHSSDRTVAVVEEYRQRHPELPIRLKKNSKTRGLAYNYAEAAFMGTGKYFKRVCGDNAEQLDSLVAILSQMGKADIIIPYLRKDNRTPLRRILSVAFTAIVNFLSGWDLKYYNGTALHLRYNIMRWHSDSYGFAYHAEILTRLLNEDATYIQVPIVSNESGRRGSKALSPQNFLSIVHSMLQIFLRRIRYILFRV